MLHVLSFKMNDRLCSRRFLVFFMLFLFILWLRGFQRNQSENNIKTVLRNTFVGFLSNFKDTSTPRVSSRVWSLDRLTLESPPVSRYGTNFNQHPVSNIPSSAALPLARRVAPWKPSPHHINSSPNPHLPLSELRGDLEKNTGYRF
jgi:hypothetical protein